jgi:hypothetical protein
LSIVSIVTNSTLGSRLNSMSAIQTPPIVESRSRLMRSAACGCSLDRAWSQARCGQTNAWKAG